MYEYDNCPKCNVSFQGEPIPKDIAEHYSGTHWRREIGIDGGYIGIYDGVVAYMCPDCKHLFPRSNCNWGKSLFDKYMKYRKENNLDDKTF